MGADRGSSREVMFKKKKKNSEENMYERYRGMGCERDCGDRIRRSDEAR